MKPPVFIVLAAYNGVDYIAQQLDSLLSQSWPCFIYVFDDGSSDGTVDLIKDKYLHHKNLILTENHKRMGYVKNFEQGIQKIYELGADYIALSDQDDIWHPNKLSQTMLPLLSSPSGEPTLVFSDLQMIDSSGTMMHLSYLSYRAYTPRTPDSRHLLATALGQNGVMGNTILMNRALLEKVLPFPSTLHSHDYWISLIAQLYGQCIFVPEALVSYRIHAQNTSNSVHSLSSSKKNHTTPFWKKLQRRDYRLPYKEDSRNKVIENLLLRPEKHQKSSKEGGAHTSISRINRELMINFLHYLNFDQPQLFLAYWVIKNKFIRKGWKHKVYVFFRVLLTKRYK